MREKTMKQIEQQTNIVPNQLEKFLEKHKQEETLLQKAKEEVRISSYLFDALFDCWRKQPSLSEKDKHMKSIKNFTLTLWNRK